MASRIVCTLNPHRVGESLTLSQGNLVVSTSAVCDFNRSVFGTIDAGAGKWAFECFFWSVLQPSFPGLIDLCAVGVAEVNETLQSPVGYGGSDGAALYPANGTIVQAGGTAVTVPAIGERRCIGVFLDMTPAVPICAWHVDGNLIGQVNLTAGSFYTPAISLGSTVAGDVSAYCNFGQSRFHYPLFSVLK